jgi:threonine/homoserine/homoserine lactone efflux protein
MSGFLIWVKSVIEKNAYLGVIIGFITTVILCYAFSLRYRGPYSIMFMTVVGFIVLVFLGVNFWKFKKNEDKDDDED